MVIGVSGLRGTDMKSTIDKARIESIASLQKQLPSLTRQMLEDWKSEGLVEWSYRSICPPHRIAASSALPCVTTVVMPDQVIKIRRLLAQQLQHQGEEV